MIELILPYRLKTLFIADETEKGCYRFVRSFFWEFADEFKQSNSWIELQKELSEHLTDEFKGIV